MYDRVGARTQSDDLCRASANVAITKSEKEVVISVCVCVCACVRAGACVHVCVCVCVARAELNAVPQVSLSGCVRWSRHPVLLVEQRNRNENAAPSIARAGGGAYAQERVVCGNHAVVVAKRNETRGQQPEMARLVAQHRHLLFTMIEGGEAHNTRRTHDTHDGTHTMAHSAPSPCRTPEACSRA